MRVKVKLVESDQTFSAQMSENNSSIPVVFKNTTIVHDGQSGAIGQNGATFIPSVSEDGVISWTNDRELPNPEPVNIKGEKGEEGYTPVKGVDYFTEEDKQEIAGMVEIPEGGGVTSWNDLTDKPFGEVEDVTELWAENEYDSSNYSYLPSPLVAFEEGKYRYTLDGIVYETDVKSYQWALYTYVIGGNPSIVNQDFNDNGQPLAFYLFNENYFLKFAPNTIGNKSFSAEKIIGIVSRPIEEKFLPDTIARVSDIPTLEEFISALPIYNGEVEEV